MPSESNMDDRQELFGIADLAKEFGISTRTIRFYENKDLIHPMRVSGSRVYTRRDRARLALIMRAKAIGSTLAQIKHFLDLYGEHGEGHVNQLNYLITETGKAIGDLETKQALIRDTLRELRAIRQASIDKLEEKTGKAFEGQSRPMSKAKPDCASRDAVE